MQIQDFAILYGVSFAIMLIFRCVPLFALKKRNLSPVAQEALSLIPPAVFAALIANDLFTSSCANHLISGEIWDLAYPFIAVACAFFVAHMSKSMVATIVVGTAVFAVCAFV